MQRKHTKAAVRILALAMLAAGLGSGCNGISLPPFTFELEGFTDVKFGPSLGLPAGLEVDEFAFEVDEVCGLPDVQQFIQTIEQEVGAFLANRLQIDAITLDNVRFTATEGDFNDITYLGAEIVLQGEQDQEIALNTGVNPDGFGTEMTLAPEAPIDVLAILRGPSSDCVSGTLEISATTPATDIVFSSTLQLTVYVSLHLF